MKTQTCKSHNMYHVTRNTFFLASIIFILGILFFSPVYAEENINVNLRIETPSQTILNQQISVPFSCEVTDNTGATSTYGGYKAICALQSAQEQGLLTYNVNNFGWGLFIEKINNIGNDANMFWSLYQNNSASMVGATDLGLSVDDKIILSYVNWNYSNEILQVVLSSSTAYINSSTTLQAQIWNNTEFVNFNSPVSFFINGTAYDAPSGTLEYISNAEGQQKIYVEAAGKTRSEIRIINIIPAPQTTTSTEPAANINHVVVNYLKEEIFNNDVSATSTWFYDSSSALFSTSTISALGVLAEASRQGNFPLTIQGGWGYYVSSIGGHAAQGFDGWIYNINQQDPGWVGMNDYQIQNNDLLAVFYSVWPWKIESNTSSVYLGENVTFKALNYTSSTWQISPSTTISINNQLFVTGDNGQHVYTPSATGTLSAFIYGSESWPQNSPTINIAVIELASTSTTATTTDDNTNENNNNSGGSDNNPATIPQSELNDAAQKILNYLKSQQSADGKIIDGTITDWAIMSFGANGQYADEIKKEGGQSLLDYEKNYNLDDPSDMNKCASYPRHVLALLASGVNKSDNAIIGLKNKIKTACYQNNLYGQTGINDDIFALLALMAIDESASEPIVSDIIAAIKSDQTADGAFTWAGWAGVDMTGAALNALKYAESKGAILEQNIYSKAKQYLKTQQLADGGWGYGASDILTTSWALMGINALNETQKDWFNASGKNPWHPLINQLKIDGYYESSWAPGTVDWFAVKHAVPALLGKSWPIILPEKITNFAVGNNITYTNYGGGSPTIESDVQIPTTTLFATTTPELSATTTLVQITTSTIEQTAASNRVTESPSPTTIIPSQNYNTTTIPKTNATPTVYYQSISSAPTSTQPISAAKTVFSISLTAASGLGLYLAWRLLQTLV